jgi:hypothetical protein
MLDLIAYSWWCLPLCAIIEKKVIVLHGGLFYKDGVKLDHIAA